MPGDGGSSCATAEDEVLEPELPIIDAHHHLWDSTRGTYLLPELLADVESGHNVVGTVFVQCKAMYRADGGSRLAPIGEVEFANGVAAMSASGTYGPVRACAGIVGYADLTAGGAVAEVLEASIARAPDRFRGIRHITAWDEDPALRVVAPIPVRDLMSDNRFLSGLKVLAAFGLSYDAYVYHPQLGDLAALADHVPQLPIVVNHMGGYLGTGRYAQASGDNFALWKRGMDALSERPNVCVKIGGIGMPSTGVPLPTGHSGLGIEELMNYWRPFVDASIEAFGPSRCMFESNFPVDRKVVSYRVLWNAFKAMTRDLSAEQRADLFFNTALRTYRLDPALAA